MFVHICYTMTYTYMMYIFIFRAKRHTNIVCCRCQLNLKRQFSRSVSPLRVCPAPETKCWLRVDTWDRNPEKCVGHWQMSSSIP